ncbi:MAG: hypothetical protein LBH75_04360 [Treponema sp.]|jgi:hypothetical protein|nr:hypothetical protein [Treponema sp.]
MYEIFFQIKKIRRLHSSLLCAAVAILLFSCDNSLGGGLFSTDEPMPVNALLLFPRRTVYETNGVFHKSEDLSVCLASEGALFQIPIDQVHITIESEEVAAESIGNSYLFPAPAVYTVTVQFKGMSDNYMVMVGGSSIGNGSNGNGNGNGNGKGGGPGIVIIWN